jgi:hypothetical protein
MIPVSVVCRPAGHKKTIKGKKYVFDVFVLFCKQI